MSTPPARVPVEERLFSLVLALLATDVGLMKNDILKTVHGYSQKSRDGHDNANLERQFERDKEDIRELGVPLETIDSPSDPGNNQLKRYRIPRGRYELPEDITFTPEESTLLTLAARVWREGSLSAESRRALTKLRSLGAATTEPVIGFAPRVRLGELAFEPLTAAIDRGVSVRFDYLKPGEHAARTRAVLPLALVNYEGRWHLSARELDSGTPKMFLLRRIVGKVTSGQPVDIPPGDHVAEALARLDALATTQFADVEVVPGSDAALRLARRTTAEDIGPNRLRLHFVDRAILADELSGFGPEVLVLSPPELREAVRERLERTAELHG